MEGCFVLHSHTQVADKLDETVSSTASTKSAADQLVSDIAQSIADTRAAIGKALGVAAEDTLKVIYEDAPETRAIVARVMQNARIASPSLNDAIEAEISQRLAIQSDNRDEMSTSTGALAASVSAGARSAFSTAQSNRNTGIVVVVVLIISP